MRSTRCLFLAAAASFLLFSLAGLTGCDSAAPGESGASTASTASSASSATDTTGGAAPEAKPQRLVFGFIPSAEADKLADTAKPMADFISKELGIPVNPFTSTDYAGMVEAMGSKKVDIGSLGPFAYVLAKDQNAAEALLKTARKNNNYTYPWMFIVRADSGIQRIEDAKGKRMAFVDPSSTSGYLYPANYLKKQGFQLDNFFSETIFAGGHDSAARAVYNGDVDIAAVYDDVLGEKLEKEIPDIKQKIRVLYTTRGTSDEIPNDVIAVRPGLPEETKQQIKAALLKYASTEEGKKTLQDVYGVTALAEVSDADYDPVREVAKAMDVKLDSFSRAKKATPAPAAKAK